jgi:hypothetical protein
MSDKTLGQQIGQVQHSFSVTNTNGDKVSLQIVIDFSSASDADVRGWLASDRTIAGQRPWRAMSKVELVEMNGRVFNAVTIGAKVKSAAEVASALLATFNGQTKDQIIETLLRTPGMSMEKAELLADAMVSEI